MRHLIDGSSGNHIHIVRYMHRWRQYLDGIVLPRQSHYL